jgi:hypothetical protein
VRFLQLCLLARPLAAFWRRVALHGSSTLLSFSPLLLYYLGRVTESKRLAVSLVFYSLLSSFG